MGKPVRRHGGEFPQPSVGAPKNAAIVDHDLGLSEQPWTSPMLLGRLLAADSGGYLACFKNRCRIQRGPPQSFARKVGWLVGFHYEVPRTWLAPAPAAAETPTSTHRRQGTPVSKGCSLAGSRDPHVWRVGPRRESLDFSFGTRIESEPKSKVRPNLVPFCWPEGA